MAGGRSRYFWASSLVQIGAKIRGVKSTLCDRSPQGLGASLKGNSECHLYLLNGDRPGLGLLGLMRCEGQGTG